MEITLKPLSDTSWEAKLDSVKALRFQLRGALDALEKLEKVSSLTASDLPILSMKGKHLYAGNLFHEVEVFLKDTSRLSRVLFPPNNLHVKQYTLFAFLKYNNQSRSILSLFDNKQ